MAGQVSKAEVEKALFGRKRGARIRVKEDPAERTRDGIVFHSVHEMGVYMQFKTLLNAGTFTKLERQVPYQIHVTSPNGVKVEVFKWLADFVITEITGRLSVYDAKGFRTEIYLLKKKCVEAEYNIRIIEV